MAGEKSKRSGEIGEALSRELLRIIGWKSLMQNVAIKCNTPEHVTDEGKPRQSHGEDQIFVYNNPFHDERTDVVHISNKNIIGEYPKVGTLRTAFKAHIKELWQTIDCAKYSPELQGICTSFGAKRHLFHSGLLIWLHNDDQDIEHDIKPELAGARLDLESDVPVYVIDNARASFLLKVVDHLERISREQQFDFDFYYPRIGTAVSVDESRRGKYLPLELLASDIIPALATFKDGKRDLYLYADQSFNEMSYKRLVAYGLSFGSGLVSSIHIGMPDFNAARDREIADKVKLSFHQRPEQVTPFAFNRSILDLLPKGGA